MITVGKSISLFFLAAGIFVLIQVALPIVNYKLWELSHIQSSLLISPQSKQQVLGISIENKDNFPAFVSNSKRGVDFPYQYFLISVPALKIDQLRVYVDSNDLSKGLIQLPGSALPGEKGNVFISGHSALPQFSQGQAVFANLPNLNNSDLIYLIVNGTKFVYKVVGLRVVDPTDLSVIPALDSVGRYVSLMTCVPPGLNTKRLVVIGKLI